MTLTLSAANLKFFIKNSCFDFLVGKEISFSSALGEYQYFLDGTRNSNLLYEFYKTPFCRTRFLEHEERNDECYKANKCDKMAYKTSIIQYFFYFAS
jgi:hypothetical protein